MKLAGDLSEEERKLTQELVEMESILDDKFRQQSMPSDRIAKGYVCVAHDWYALYCEEEGHRVLDKSEIVCPGYFKNFVQKHMAEDGFYDKIMNSLDGHLTLLMMDTLKGIKLKDEE
jgi:hypothetical protein